ncbi:MAG: lipopolysaccharide heptosyltransferase II [Nitrospirae bacterium]|nr:lipopolysaccharide heptosyltransferase II [Nitrospirota bacterium]
MKILIVAPNWLGDAVLALPAIAAIRQAIPASSVTILGLQHICDLFKESPYADNTLVYSGSLLSTVKDIRKFGFDTAILFPNSFRTAMLVYIARIPLRCGYIRDGRGPMLNIGIKVDAQTRKLTQTQYYLNLAKSILWSPVLQRKMSAVSGEGVSAQMKTEWLYLSQDELQHAKETIRSFDIQDGSLIIGINPGAAYGSAKRWYPERFALVARTLVNQCGAKVILFGSRQEREIAAEIENLAGVPLINMAGKTTIRELMSLIKQCHIFITNDSGPMHIASALDVPVVAIFGSTDPEKTGPMGSRHVIIRKEAECSPCFKRNCPTDLRCMDSITVDDVLAGAKRFIG